MIKHLIAVILLACCTPNIYAQAAGTIGGLQLPAWIERNGTTIPAYPGMTLEQQDTIKLGNTGKANLNLAEGSLIKLGNNAEFELRSLRQNDSNSAFIGLLNVISGAFRFSTTPKGNGVRRNIDVLSSRLTIGVRGTDFWGQTSADRDFVVLIEGQIEIAEKGGVPIDVNTPLALFDKQGAAPATQSSIDMPTLLKFAPLTELDTGAGVLQPNGRYAVVVQSTRNEAPARALAANLQALGYPAVVSAAEAFGARWHRVLIERFASLADAVSFTDAINGTAAINGAWVLQQ